VLGLALVILYMVEASLAISCTSELQSLDCLPVFSHSPGTLQKCYCTARCPSAKSLRDSCHSGQLQTDPCGICLQCAPGYGEECGGFANAAGTCSGGLGCLVRYQPGRETEHNKTGTCVTEQGDDCKKPRTGVSCRPGQLGVPSDFLFCPSCPKQGGAMGTRNEGSAQGFLFSGQGNTDRRQENRPSAPAAGADSSAGSSSGGSAGSFVSSLLDSLPGSIKQTITDRVRDNLGGRK